MRAATSSPAMASAIGSSILDAIGSTPLVRLSRFGEGLTAQLVAKVEYLNPGGSIKDRVAVSMIEAAERDGRIGNGWLDVGVEYIYFRRDLQGGSIAAPVGQGGHGIEQRIQASAIARF